MLTYSALRDALPQAQAVRLSLRLEAAGGAQEHVNPPTYPGEGRTDGPRHALESRWIDGVETPCVVLDSVQSQANRLELALLAEHRERGLALPHLAVTLPDHGQPRRFTSLELSHRAADAVFRDSLLDGEAFQDSAVGRAMQRGDAAATALFETDPASLLHGVWWSTGLRTKSNVRMARALTSSITGIDFRPGVKPASRLDPLGIVRQVALERTADGDWAVIPADEVRKAKKPVRPAEINYGNVKPDLPALGGSIRYALHTAVLSLIRLRQLRFPDADGVVSAERNSAARAVLAAMGLVELTAQLSLGYDLRSGCLLVPAPPLAEQARAGTGGFALLGEAGAEPLDLDHKAALALYAEAVATARAAGFAWREGALDLVPAAKLVALKETSDLTGGGEDEAES